jgi:hypothetical protein
MILQEFMDTSVTYFIANSKPEFQLDIDLSVCGEQYAMEQAASANSLMPDDQPTEDLG